MSVHMTKTKKHNELEILRPFKILCQFSIIKLTMKMLAAYGSGIIPDITVFLRYKIAIFFIF